jgi:DNA-binding SARP family transcriptional activator/tetratricopeptide (TPR) repeat protein
MSCSTCILWKSPHERDPVEQRRYLRCLGQPALFAPTGELIRFRTKKHLALLIYIAVEDRSHRRDRLAELLWPKVSPSEARHSLATGLSTLRPRLGPDGLESSRDHVRLAPDRVSLDLERLEAADVLGSEITGPLEVAAFLDGFDIPDSAEFTHWKDRQQARLLPLIKDALVVLIDRCRRTSDTRKIEKLADRMLVLDDLSEEAIRAKMEARAFAGDRLTALEIFEEWKAKLADELQAAPSDLVEGMAVRLRRRGWERTTLPKIPNVPTDQWRGRPFIGRTSEYRVLYEAWEDVRRGIPRHALILGDSGVGKSTLVERLTTAAGLEGAAISRVQCYDLDREIPYSALSTLILGLLDRPGVSAAAPDSLAELSRAVPEVRRRFPNIPSPDDSQGETARIRLTEAFHEMLSAIAEEQPVILVVDDLHLADDVSLAVLHLIMRRTGRRGVMVMLVARSGELAQSPQAAKMRDSAGVLALPEIELLPFTEEESREMLKTLLPADQPHPNSTVERALLRAAAGYPMALELLVRDWQESREQSLALSVNAMTEDPSYGSVIQTPYRHILDRITRSLDATTHNVLNLASLLGQRLNDLSMYTLVDLSVGQTMSGMAQLVSRRVLRDSARGLEFVNEMVRAAAYVGVPGTLRRVLHGKIGDRLIREHGSTDEDLGLEIAWHCIRSGRITEATPHLLSGARESIRSGIPHGAERGLSTALPHLNEPEKSEASLLLAEALQEQSRWQESLAALEDVNVAQRSSTADLVFVLKAKARRRLDAASSRYPEDLLTSLLAFIHSTGDPPSRIRAAVEAASILNAYHSQSSTPLLLERLSSFANVKLELDDITHLMLAKSMLHYNLKDFATSLRYIREATALLERHTTNSVVAMLHLGTGTILSAQGNYSGSTRELMESYEIALRIGNERVYLQAASNLALTLCRLGDYETSLEWVERGLQDTISIGSISRFAAAHSALLAYAMLQKYDRAEEVIGKRGEEIARLGSLGFTQAWALYSADSYMTMGKVEEAHETAEPAVSRGNDQLYMDFCVGPYARWVARSGFRHGELCQASKKIDQLMERLPSYDLVDQAEILNAKIWLDSRQRHICPQQLQQMRSYLDSLPAAVGHQLRCMGMLDFPGLPL